MLSNYMTRLNMAAEWPLVLLLCWPTSSTKDTGGKGSGSDLNPATATCKTCSSLTYPPATLLALHEMEVSKGPAFKGPHRLTKPDTPRGLQAGHDSSCTRSAMCNHRRTLRKEGRLAETAQDSRATSRGLCTGCVIWDQTRWPGGMLGSPSKQARRYSVGRGGNHDGGGAKSICRLTFRA
jgi:hypothetical protein